MEPTPLIWNLTSTSPAALTIPDINAMPTKDIAISAANNSITSARL
jgi:hypothetical protein